MLSSTETMILLFSSDALNKNPPPSIDFFHVCQHAAAISVVTLKAVRHVIAVLAAFIVAAHQRLRRVARAVRRAPTDVQIPVL